MLDALPVGRQKFILGRLLGYTALERSRDAALVAAGSIEEGLRASETFHAMHAHLDSVTGSVLPERTSTESVDEFLGALAERIAALPPVPGCEPYVESITRDVEAHLASPADPFAAAFAHALEACVSLYEECGPVDASRIRAELVVDARHRPGFDRAPAVGGATVPRGSDLVVRLGLSAGELGPEELRAVPYVFFHELICHALGSRQALRPGTWTEVWMDLVAWTWHAARVGGLPRHWPLQATRDAATLVHLARYRVTRSDPQSSVRAAARRGANASHERADRHDPDWAFGIFCVAVNRSSIDAWQRDEAAERLGAAIDAAHAPAPDAFSETVERVLGAAPEERVEIADAFMRALNNE